MEQKLDLRYFASEFDAAADCFDSACRDFIAAADLSFRSTEGAERDGSLFHDGWSIIIYRPTRVAR